MSNFQSKLCDWRKINKNADLKICRNVNDVAVTNTMMDQYLSTRK